MARVIGGWVSGIAVADPSWLPAAGCVDFADSFTMVGIQHSENQHSQILFGGPLRILHAWTIGRRLAGRRMRCDTSSTQLGILAVICDREFSCRMAKLF